MDVITMRKLFRKIAFLILPVLCAIALAACGADRVTPVDYNVAGVSGEIPPITSVVGDRKVIGSSVARYAKAEAGNMSVSCTYSGAENPAEDFSRYAEVLKTEHNFLEAQSFDGQTMILATKSSISGQEVRITLHMEGSDGYTVRVEALEVEAASDLSSK